MSLKTRSHQNQIAQLLAREITELPILKERLNASPCAGPSPGDGPVLVGVLVGGVAGALVRRLVGRPAPGELLALAMGDSVAMLGAGEMEVRKTEPFREPPPLPSHKPLYTFTVALASTTESPQALRAQVFTQLVPFAKARGSHIHESVSQLR